MISPSSLFSIDVDTSILKKDYIFLFYFYRTSGLNVFNILVEWYPLGGEGVRDGDY
jgi:hypothetical protein